jgi:hypothetical protein
MISVAWDVKISRRVELTWEVTQINLVFGPASHALIQFGNSCGFFNGSVVSTVAKYPGDPGFGRHHD